MVKCRQTSEGQTVAGLRCCRYERYASPPMCPKYEQEVLAQYFVKQAMAGSQNAQGLLELTPCDFWPLIQGRSLWLIGDSITMVSFLEC